MHEIDKTLEIDWPLDKRRECVSMSAILRVVVRMVDRGNNKPRVGD